jgi:SPP1 family predicted phage head-tail adaptor
MLTTSVPVGKLDRKVTIQQPVYTTNDHNEDEITSWATVATVWASAEQRQGNEVIDADRLTYYETTIFTIRHRDDLNVRMRIIWGSTPYRIFSITEHKSSRKGFLSIASEVVDNETVNVEGFEFTEEFSEEFNA